MVKQQQVFGLHAVYALLSCNPATVKQLVLLKARHDQRLVAIQGLAEQYQIPFHFVSRSDLDTQAATSAHQGVLAIVSPESRYTENDLPRFLELAKTPPLVLVLDGVQDPHNLGACLRTADAAGVHAVIVPKDRAVGLTATVRKVASGAAETIPFIAVTNLARSLTDLKQQGFWVYGADSEASATVFTTDLTGPVVLVMGAEGNGLRRLTREHCDGLLKIPMQGAVASLNVSVATAVCLFEIVRQRS